MNTQSEPNFYRRNPDGSAVLDGYPVVWTDVLQPYTEDAAPNAPLMVFGALQFWFFGQRGMPRMDMSADVLFLNDQLATRFIEEVDFDYQALDAAAVLLTAAG
jgi:HK97 family phage major capsid protein